MIKEIILNFLRENRALLERQFGVQKIGLFGSYARDEAIILSDIVYVEAR